MRTFVPEDTARALHRRLRSAFWLHRPRVEVSLDGDDAHWSCHAASPDRRCTIACQNSNGGEFLIAFHGDHDASWGRTASYFDTIGAVRLWLAGTPLPGLIERYPFVDSRRRAFAEIQRAVFAADPRIAAAVTAQVVHESCDHHRMRLATAGDRAILLTFYGRNPHPDASLLWDECPLVSTTVIYPPTFAVIVRRWLLDAAPPSEMQADFPWLLIRPEAPYYEQGRPIEGEFIVSWDRLEDHLADHGPGAAAILRFVAALRAAGLAETLRASHTAQSTILSRARRPQLRPEQPRVTLQFHAAVATVTASFADISTFDTPLTSPSPALLDLLHRLAAQPID